MTSYIPRLARIASGIESKGKRSAPQGDGALRSGSMRALARIAPEIRQRLAIGRPFSDAALLASLAAIASYPSHEERWRAASVSTLGQYIANSSQDVHGALVTLLSLLPAPDA
jgi:O-antigen ligase